MNFDLDELSEPDELGTKAEDFYRENTTVEILEENFSLSRIEQARIDFDKYKVSVAVMDQKAAALDIIDDATNQTAVEMAGQSAAMFKKIEDKRKEIVKEPNEFIKAVNAFAKQYTERLDDIKRLLGFKITRYDQEQTRSRLEAQRKANEEAKRLQDEIDAAAKANNETPAVVVAPVVFETPKITRTSAGSASQKTTWTFEVKDFAALPDKFKQVDRVAINAEVKAGIRQIPGVRIYQEQKTQIRSAALPQFDNLEQF